MRLNGKNQGGQKNSTPRVLDRVRVQAPVPSRAVVWEYWTDGVVKLLLEMNGRRFLWIQYKNFEPKRWRKLRAAVLKSALKEGNNVISGLV